MDDPDSRVDIVATATADLKGIGRMLRGFADGFQMYDLLAKRFRPYAVAYPFIELTLGLAYLTFWRPTTVYAATIVVLGFGALGVINALRRGLDIECACMGTVLQVPLSTVALAEDLGMVLMALAMWLRPSATIWPQEGVGGGIPAPRKLSEASTMMTNPM